MDGAVTVSVITTPFGRSTANATERCAQYSPAAYLRLRQVLLQEAQCQPQDATRRPAVVEQVEGVRTVRVVHESNREIVDQSLTYEFVDRRIHRWKLILPCSRDQ